MKRVKSPLVEPAKRREWFRLYEEEGRSPIKIAAAEKYDVRTVKRAIDLERQEREKKETRYLVLRNATEQHYADLCKFTQQLESRLGSERVIHVAGSEDPLLLALKEHLPRSIIWKNLDKWEHLKQEIQQLNKQLEELLEARIEAALKGKKTSSAPGLNQRLFYILNLHIKEAAQARPEILQKFDFEKIPESKDSQIKDLIESILQEAAGWKEYNQLMQRSNELRQVNKVLHDELLIIKMRRVVPGHCRYCPM